MRIVKIILISIFVVIVIVVLRVMVPFISSLVTTLNNCDNTDYSPIIKKVAVPMQRELEIFYTKNKRFPTSIERNEMLKKVGCVMDKGICIIEGNNINIRVEEKVYRYILVSSLGRAGCYSAIDNDGEYTKVSCGKSPCISLKQ